MYDLLMNIMFKENRNIDVDFLTKFFNRIKLEKPDFEIKSDAIQIITLLSIYSKIGNGCMSFSTNHKDNFSRLEKLVVSLFGNDLVNHLKDYYNIGFQTVKSDKSFFVFKPVSVNQSIGHIDFPSYLYWTAK